MSQPEKTKDSKTDPKKPAAKTLIKEVLGRISVDKESATVEGEGVGNSTRWVMHVALEQPVDVTLLHFTNGKELLLETLAVSLAPMNDDCWTAKPFVQIDKGVLQLRRSGQGSPQFCLTVDALLPQELKAARDA